MKNFIFKLRAIWGTFVNRVAAIAVDKYLHFIAGGVVAFIPCMWKSTIHLAMVIAMLAGLFKEILDAVCGGRFDWKDALATALGGIVVQIAAIVLYFMWM